MRPSLTCEESTQLPRCHGVDDADLRITLRRYSHAASALVSTTQSKIAELIARQVVERTSPYLDATSVSMGSLRELTDLSKGLMLAAFQAEKLDHRPLEAPHE